MSIVIVTHDSRLDRLPKYFVDKFPTKKGETPQEYMQRLLLSPKPFNGFDKCPKSVTEEIWRLTTRLVNRKYQQMHESEQMYNWETNQTGTYEVKTGKNKGRKYIVINDKFIWVPERPKWFALDTGNEVPFSKVRYLAGEIYPIVGKGAWYNLSTHRFESYGKKIAVSIVWRDREEIDDLEKEGIKLDEEEKKRRVDDAKIKGNS